MSAVSLASYVIRKLKSDEAATGDMSGRGRGSPTPHLTTVWRTKSIPYDIPDTSYPLRNEGSLLKLLRTKSMPLLGKEGSTPPRLQAIPPLSRSSARSESPSPVRHPTSRAVSSRKISIGHLSDASESTVPSLATPPPTPRSPSPTRPRTRSASDGHLWQRRKKQLRRDTDKAAITLPSVKNLRGKFDEMAATPLGDKQPTAGPEHLDDDTQKEDETGEGREGRRVSRHYSLLRREVRSPERRQPPKTAVTPANVRKILEKFEISPQNEDEASEVYSQDLRSKSRSEVSLKTNAMKVPEEDQIHRRRSLTSRQRTKNHRRSKSEPDPSAVLRHHAQTAPPSVKKLKHFFEREALAEGGNDFPKTAAPERTIPLEQQKETTPEPLQVREHHGKTTEEMAVVDGSVTDKLHLGVVDATEPRQKAKTPPIVQALTAGTPSVRSLRQRFEEGASAQSSLKTAGGDVAPRPRRAMVHQLKTPFAKPRQKSRSVSPDKEARQSLTSFSSASVKNLLRQFEALSPEETLQAEQDGLGHEPRSPLSPLPTDPHKLLMRSLDNVTGEAQQDPKSTIKVILEVEVDSNWPQQSRRSSSSSSSDDEWREEKGRQRRKEMERERKEQENEKERQRIEQEQKTLREREEKMKIEKENEIIRKVKENERREKARAKQERDAKEKEEERRALEILEREREAQEKLEEERKIRESAEQERLAEEEKEKRKEKELLEQRKNEKEKAELIILKREREEKERKEREKEEEEKERERVRNEKEMEEKAKKEQREREKVEREKAQEERRKKCEREEAERLHNEQQEEQRQKEEAKSRREEFMRRLSGEDMPKGVGHDETHENDNKSDDKSSDRKVHEMIDRFTHLKQHGDALQPDTSSTPQGEASSEPRVEQLIDQFTNLRDVDLELEAGRGDNHYRHDAEGHKDEGGDDRRYSDVAALVSKFCKLTARRESSSSSESDGEGGKSRKRSVKEEAPIPTIPARTNVPGTVRTLREDEMRFFESAGGGTEPFMRTQSLRVKKEQSHFSQPRFGSVRGSKSNKSRVAVLSTSGTTTPGLPRNCRRLNTDELQFFTGEVTNIYRNRTTKQRSRAGKTGGDDGRLPNVPRNNTLPDTEEFFRIAGRANQGGDPNGRPATSENDSDSEPGVFRSSDDVITDSESDIYELDINLRSDADTEDPSDTEHHWNLDQTLSMFVHSIQGELLQPVATEGCKEGESRCYVVFSPDSYLSSSDDEDGTLESPFASPKLKENVSTPVLKENEFSVVQMQEITVHDTPGEAVMLKPSTGNTKEEQSNDKHNKSEDYTSPSRRFNHSSEEDATSSQIIDLSQHSGVTTKENGAGIDFLGETKVDLRSLELKGLVLTECETGETGETGNKEEGQYLLISEGKSSSHEENKEEKEEEVNVKKVNLQENFAEERDPDELLLQEEQRAIAAFLDELDRLNSLPRIIPPLSTRRKENRYKDMTDDDTSSVTNSDDDDEGHTDLSPEDVRSIEEQIIPSASIQELLVCPEGPSGTPRGDDGPSGTTKDFRDTEIPLQDSITHLRTTEDLFIAASPSETRKSVPITSFNDALKEEKEEVKEEDGQTSPLPLQYPERQEEERWTGKKGDSIVAEGAEQNTSPLSLLEEETDIITGREFIKFCVFSLWFSLLIYFFSDILD